MIYPHLTRQHWISSLSLILPGNDDDSHLRTPNGQTALAALAAPGSGSSLEPLFEAAATEMALRIHLT